MSDGSAMVVKHMGRLVHDPDGVCCFAGSTTGVHFVLSFEDTCRQALYLAESFPESCYSLYLAGPAIGTKPTWSAAPDGGNLFSRFPSHEILELVSHPADFYIGQVDCFFNRWEAFCPVLARRQLVDARATMVDADDAFSHVSRSVGNTLNTEMGLLVSYISIVDGLQSRLVARGDVQSLQGLILLSFYYQRTGHSLALIRLNASMKLGEIELRKRLWWWVYTFDRVTAIVHGLPSLISDADVDNELPTDCQLDDFTATELLYPLPGQMAPVSFFNQYAVLGHKMSSILDLLYTTTQRRQANGCGSMILWLRLLTHFCIILIHRPGLTFDDNTKEFAACLAACIRASIEIIHLLLLPEMEQSFPSFSPFGPGLVFQCALMHVYCQRKSKTIDLPGMPALHESASLISNGINLLGKYRPNSRTAPSENLGHEDRQIPSIDLVITVLKYLTVLLQQGSSQSLSWPAESPLSDTPYALPTSSLYELNYMTAVDWAQDITDTFHNLPDLGG
ncbi:hypothetical protein BJX63DRAFT_426514 [Aspergillus granulosus]|uniref:Xylanolytic transcriptional activator regulatory domain-containing protein n=1 Tax=Aspergillus granulosus TaxID=176169 RepID=A0ABR4GRV8_9EURO